MALKALLTLLVAFGALSTDLYLPSLPAIQHDFATGIEGAQATLSVFLAGFAGAMLVWGPLSDRFGRRPILLMGMVVYAVSGLACAAATSLDMLIAARFFQALGACAAPVVARAVVRDLYERDDAARVMSYMAMAMAVVPTLGPILGGSLQGWFGWQANFLVLAGLGVVGAVLTAFILPETNAHRAVTSLRFSLIVGNYLHLARHRHYVGFVVTMACAYSGIFAFISGSSFVLIGTLGIAPETFGFLFGSAVLGYMAGSFISARFTARLGFSAMITTGAVCAAAGGVVMVGLALSAPPSVEAVIFPVMVYLAGVGMVSPNVQAGAIAPFPRMAGAASALAGFTQMLVAAIMGGLVGLFHDGTALPMAVIMAIAGLGTLAAFRLIVRPEPART